MNAASLINKLPLVLLLLLLLSMASCDSKRQSVHPTASAPARQMSGENRSPASSFDLPLGTSYQEVVEQMGNPDADYGSGVEIPEYSLLPCGHAVVFCDMDHAVHLVVVSWASEPDGTKLPEWSDITGGPDLSSLEAEHLESTLPSERIDPRLLLGVKRGMSISDLGRQIGLRFDAEKESQSLIGFRLDPHGIATIGVQEDHTVSDVSLIWWRGE